MKRLPRISNDDINEWISQDGVDARSWTLRPEAPSRIVDVFPELVDAMLSADALPATGVTFDEQIPESVDMANPSTLFVRIWQLARSARRHSDEAAAIGLDMPLAGRLEAHATELELLRDQIHDALLTDDDRAKGAVPRTSADS